MKLLQISLIQDFNSMGIRMPYWLDERRSWGWRRVSSWETR